MKPLEPSDVVDLETYEASRPETLQRIKQVKENRRIELGAHLVFLFENHETMRYQLHEALRAKKASGDEEVERELAHHNGLLGGDGELACTLLIQIEDLDERDVKLREWTDLPQHLFVVIDVGRHVPARFDPRQIRPDRLSSVQYLKFDCGGAQPVAIVCTRPGMETRLALTEAQKAALAEDLGIEP